MNSIQLVTKKPVTARKEKNNGEEISIPLPCTAWRHKILSLHHPHLSSSLFLSLSSSTWFIFRHNNGLPSMYISKICVRQNSHSMMNVMAYEGSDIKQICRKRHSKRKSETQTKERKHIKVLTDQAWSVMLRASWGRRGNKPSHHWLSSTLTFWLSWISLGWGWLWSCRLRCDSHCMGCRQCKLLYYRYFHVPCSK